MDADNTFDTLETMLILAMDAKAEESRNVAVHRAGRNISDEVSLNSVLKLPEMRIDSAFIALPTDVRYYTVSPDQLLDHPAEIIGNRAQVMVMHENLVKWVGFKRLSSAPKGCIPVMTASHWYAIHYREINTSGLQGYHVSPMAFNRRGKAVPVKYGNTFVGNDFQSRMTPILCASAIEDATSANTILVSISEGTEVELKFPVPLDSYKELFALRDGPYNGNRKKAIIHWVAKHLRRKKDETTTPVKEHLRGIHEFEVDGLKIKLTPNARVHV